MREMGNLNTNKLEIKATFMSGYVTDRIITAKNNAKIKITGNYLDIGENTFIAEDTSSYLLAETVKLTNYNDYYEELWDSKPAYLHYKSISQEKMIDQFILFGLNKEMETAPKFDIALGDYIDLFILSRDLLSKYSTFSANAEGENNRLQWGIQHTFDGYEEGKSLYNGDVLNTEHQAVKNPINIKLAEFLGQLPSNAVVVCDGQEYAFNQNLYNIVFRGDASKIKISGFSSGSSHGVILAENQAPNNIPALDECIYIFKEYPTKDNGWYNLGGEKAEIDFSKAPDTITGTPSKNITTVLKKLYLKNGVDANLLINEKVIETFLKDSIITPSSPSAQTIQEFEQKGNTALGHFGNN